MLPHLIRVFLVFPNELKEKQMATEKLNNRKVTTEELLASSDEESVLLGPQRQNYKGHQAVEEIPTQIATPRPKTNAGHNTSLFHPAHMVPGPYHGHNNYYVGPNSHSMSMSSTGFIFSQPRSQENAFAELEAMLATQNQAQRMPPPKYQGMVATSRPETPQSEEKSTQGKKNKKKKAPLPPRDKRHNFYDDELHDLLDLIEEVKPVSSSEWELIGKRHHEENGWPLRKNDNLKRKWLALMKDALKYKTGDPNITEMQVRIRRISYMLTGKSGATDMSMEAGGIEAALDANHFGAEAGEPTETMKAKRLDGKKPLTTKKGRTTRDSFLESIIQIQETQFKREQAARMEEREIQRRRDRKQDKLMMTLAMAIIGQGTQAGGANSDNGGIMSTFAKAFADSSDEDEPAKKKARVSTSPENPSDSEDSDDDNDIYGAPDKQSRRV